MEASSPFEILVFSDSRNSKDYVKIKHKVNTETMDGEGIHTGEILSVLRTKQNKKPSVWSDKWRRKAAPWPLFL